MLDKLTIIIDNMFDCAVLCNLQDSLPPLVDSLFNVLDACPIWICNLLLMRESLTIIKKKHELKFSFVRPDIFGADPPGPTDPIFCSPAPSPHCEAILVSS